MSKAQRTVSSSTLAASGRASTALTIIVDLTMILRVLSRLLDRVKYDHVDVRIYIDISIKILTFVIRLRPVLALNPTTMPFNLFDVTAQVCLSSLQKVILFSSSSSRSMVHTIPTVSMSSST